MASLAAGGADLGVILHPAAGAERHLGRYDRFAVDNGYFSAGASFDATRWLGWLDTLPRDRCLFVVAPDVFDPALGRGDADATWRRSTPHFETIRSMGFQAALTPAGRSGVLEGRSLGRTLIRWRTEVVPGMRCRFPTG